MEEDKAEININVNEVSKVTELVGGHKIFLAKDDKHIIPKKITKKDKYDEFKNLIIPKAS